MEGHVLGSSEPCLLAQPLHLLGSVLSSRKDWAGQRSSDSTSSKHELAASY